MESGRPENLTEPNDLHHHRVAHPMSYSTVTDFARFLGLSTSVPRAHAV